MYVPARCSVSIGNLCTFTSAGVPPPETTGTANAGALEQAKRLVEEVVRARKPARERHQALELHSRQRIVGARQVERRLRRLHAVAAHAGVAFDEEAHVAP